VELDLRVFIRTLNTNILLRINKMGQSLTSFKKSLLLTEIVKEIFDSEPFKTNFTFQPSEYATVETPRFQDPLGNVVKIYFTENDEDLYEVEFSINGSSFQSPNVNYNIKDYSKLLSTIAQGINAFIEQYQPQGILIKGTDIFQKVSKNPKTIGQKDRLYLYFISQIEDKGKYMLDKSNPEGIALMKK
jgi:hypothetical protein